MNVVARKDDAELKIAEQASGQGASLAEQLNAELFECESEERKVAPGEEFSKAWTFTNTGSIAWPKGVQLMLTQGDRVMSRADSVEEPI